MTVARYYDTQAETSSDKHPEGKLDGVPPPVRASASEGSELSCPAILMYGLYYRLPSY
jgi:hypothetical protein